MSGEGGEGEGESLAANRRFESQRVPTAFPILLSLVQASGSVDSAAFLHIAAFFSRRPYFLKESVVGQSFPWTGGRVPNGFWDRGIHRRKYMDWLGGRLRYRKPEDWYAVRKRDFQANYGGGMLARVYGDSPIAAVKEYLGDFELHPWCFNSVPKGFWEIRANRLAYMNWLGKRLNYHTPQDWYGIKKSHFKDNEGGGLLGSIYNHSPQCAVAELFPNFHFLPWMFTTVPQGYWQETNNRLTFLMWLGEKKNVQSFADWQRLKRSDFKENGGAGLLNSYYKDSPEKAIQEYLANRPETER